MQASLPILVVLFLIGASSAHISWKISGDTSSDLVIRKFLETLDNAVASRQASQISAIFADEFNFEGCAGNHNKAQTVTALTKLPSDIQIVSTLKSSKYLSGDTIEYLVAVGGLNKAPKEAVFTYCISRGVLTSGKLQDCPKRQFGKDFNAEYVVHEFLDDLTYGIQKKNIDLLSKLFTDSFYFKGCKKVYGKADVIGIVEQLPSGTPFLFTIKSANFLSKTKIVYVVTVTGFGPAPIEAQFHLDAEKHSLTDGNIQHCPKKNFYGVVQDDAKSIINVFLRRMAEAIGSKDSSQIAGLFSENFFFKGCKGNYNKAQVTSLLSNVPAGSKSSFKLVSAKFISSDKIEYTVSISGFTATPFEAKFLLCTSTNTLSGGSIPVCPKRQFRMVDTADTVAAGFLNRMTKTIQSKDASQIAGLFSDAFFFKGCKGNYNKAQITALIGKLPVGTPFSLALKSAKYISADKVEYTVTISGFSASPFEALFILNVSKSVLTGGSVPVCPTRRFTIMVTAETIILGFLNRMTKAIQSKDASQIASLFAHDFFFKGCKGTYDKAQIIALIAKFPAGTPFSLTFKSAKYMTTESIKYTVTVAGFTASPFDVEFVYRVGESALTSGTVPVCSRRRLLMNPAETVVTAFLERMTKALESRDQTAISSLFSPAFTFKGCKGTYNKAQVTGLIGKLPAGSPFTFILKSAKYLSTDNIEYVVSVSGFSATPMEIQFHFCVGRQALTDGNIQSCLKRRSSQFWSS